MPNVDFDSDDAATTGDYRSKYNRLSVSPSNQKSSILKKKVQYSDDEDDNYQSNSGRLSNRNRYDEPISSRSDMMSAKPPNGRNLSSSLSNRVASDSREYSNYKPKNLPALTYPKNDSDDSISERYNKFKKEKSSREDSKYTSKMEPRSIESKFESVYDSYPPKLDPKYEDFSKYDENLKHTRESPLTSTKKFESLDDMNYKSLKIRSNSLDRLNSTLPSSINSTSSKLLKYNSTNNIDNGSDKSYSLNSTSLSIREAKNRSFLVGSLSALNGKGLLSTDELDRHFMDRKAKILVATWNMGGVKKPPNNLDQLVLPDVIQNVPDILIFGVQEFALNQKVWEISLQEQIGPTHVKLSSYYHGSIGITIFVKRELIWFCSIVEYEHINFRPVQAPSRTKASVLVTFQLFGTLMCFICSHFAAGEGNLDTRVQNYKQTIENLKLPKKLQSKNPTRLANTDGTENFDIVFWLGDLNFLVTKEKDKVERKVNSLRNSRGINYEDILNYDELNQVMAEERAFRNFLEGRITFEPTYKYDINTDTYDTSHKIRIPSYCDRILFKSRQKGSISCYHYNAVKDIKLSDHRPVFGLYEVTIRPGVDKVPLSYGEFDRQIYAAGYQRRQMFRAHDVGFDAKKSTCNIQ
ncbi:unnamed protein product [Brachionus calyciflorus]|uniref:Inositol polyphosphate-related phosphatase domain-containing protein n=1 Tax=Brachionus calyciflorus TaxID=104777 RepID=A0A813XH04_9BILA|nr:unnamed protein product [Brachionus calyciflorus]